MKPRSQEHKDKIRLALMGRETKPVEERFYSKVRIDLNGCWNWTGAIKPNGYGSFNIKRYNTSKTFNTHRWSYEYLKGPIPEELTLDHLCRNRRCVNPDHLEIVSIKENLLRGMGFSGMNARKTHCKNGHPLVPYLWKGTAKRYCPICTWERTKQGRIKNREHYLAVRREWWRRNMSKDPMRKPKEEVTETS